MLDYGYRADYIHEGKLMLKLYREGSLLAEHLDAHAIQMLSTNVIPQMLQMEVNTIDEQAQLLYSISGKRQLLPQLMVEACTEHQYYEWLLQLVRMLEDCRNYLLQPNHVLLHEQVLFIDGSIQGGKLYVPYVPTIEPLHPRAAIDSLQRIAMRLSSEVKEWKGDGLQRLIQLLYRDNLSFIELRQFIQSNLYPVASEMEKSKLIEQALDNHVPQHNISPGLSIPSSKAAQIHYMLEAEQQMPSSEVPLAATELEQDRSSSTWWNSKERLTPAVSPAIVPKSVEAKLDPRPSPAKPSQSWIISLGIAAAIIALGWKFGYMRSTGTAGLILSGLISCLGVAVGYFYKRGLLAAIVKGKPQHPSETPRESIMNTTMRDNANVTSLANAAAVKSKFPTTMKSTSSSSLYDEWGEHSKDERSIAFSISRQQEAVASEKTLTEYTTLLSADDSLEQAGYSMRQKRMRPVLERMDADLVVDSHELDQWPFVIGRAEQGVHLTIRESGISKLHCELRLEDGTYWVQDYGSKNGTELQGKLLIPYKKVALAAGDELKLAQISFRFKLLPAV